MILIERARPRTGRESSRTVASDAQSKLKRDVWRGTKGTNNGRSVVDSKVGLGEHFFGVPLGRESHEEPVASSYLVIDDLAVVPKSPQHGKRIDLVLFVDAVGDDPSLQAIVSRNRASARRRSQRSPRSRSRPRRFITHATVELWHQKCCWWRTRVGAASHRSEIVLSPDAATPQFFDGRLPGGGRLLQRYGRHRRRRAQRSIARSERSRLLRRAAKKQRRLVGRVAARVHFRPFLMLIVDFEKTGAGTLTNFRIFSQKMLELSLRRQVELLTRREVSAVDLMNSSLRRLESVNSRINGVVTTESADVLLKEAKRVDDMKERPPLAGVPITIKDSLSTAGLRTTSGTMGRANFVPSVDATVVSRLKAAGAVVIAKSSTPELTLGFETTNELIGPTNNPYKLDRTCGGSSGGAAALIASCASALDVGTDYGGSIRVPSAWCGITGIKPTNGRVPRTGHVLDALAGVTESFQTVGPLARTVGDLRLALDIIQGPDGKDPYVHPVGTSLFEDQKHLRVAHFADKLHDFEPCRAVAEAVSEVARVLHAENGASSLPQETNPEKLWRNLALADGGRVYRQKLEECGTKPWDVSSSISWIYSAQPLTSSLDYGDLIIQVTKYRQEMLEFFEKYDALVCPVTASLAPEHGFSRENMDNFLFTYMFNVTGHPSVVVPTGIDQSTGLPVGVQIVARHWREDVCLALAARVEESFGGWQPSPLFPPI